MPLCVHSGHVESLLIQGRPPSHTLAPLTPLSRALRLSWVWVWCPTPRDETTSLPREARTHPQVGDMQDVKPPSTPMFCRLQHSHPSLASEALSWWPSLRRSQGP